MDYELIHKLILRMLVEIESAFLSNLASAPRKCIIEPAGGLYDLEIVKADGSGAAVEIEIKVWSPLSPGQISRQIAHVRSGTVYYLLLGRTAVQWPRMCIQQDTAGLGTKLSYKELINQLDGVLQKSSSDFGRELAGAHRAALVEQRERILKSFGDPDS